MNQTTNHEETFNQYRPLLFSIAYRMLGSTMDAEDMVQETFLRWQTALRDGETTIDSPKAYLSAVVTRLCIDNLRSAHSQRESYIGPWLPEPLLTEEAPDPAGSLSESLSIAFLVVLENLSPLERAVFLLREIFEYEYSEIAGIVDKTEANCRQMVKRARDHIAAKRPRFNVSSEQRERITMQFLQVCATGDMQGFLSLLEDDITLLSDGGGKAQAARHPVFGADHVARFVFGILKKAPENYSIKLASINGATSIISYVGNDPVAVLTLDIAGEKIRGIHIVANPDKLKHIPAKA